MSVVQSRPSLQLNRHELDRVSVACQGHSRWPVKYALNGECALAVIMFLFLVATSVVVVMGVLHDIMWLHAKRTGIPMSNADILCAIKPVVTGIMIVMNYTSAFVVRFLIPWCTFPVCAREHIRALIMICLIDTATVIRIVAVRVTGILCTGVPIVAVCVSMALVICHGVTS